MRKFQRTNYLDYPNELWNRLFSCAAIKRLSNVRLLIFNINIRFNIRYTCAYATMKVAYAKVANEGK